MIKEEDPVLHSDESIQQFESNSTTPAEITEPVVPILQSKKKDSITTRNKVTFGVKHIVTPTVENIDKSKTPASNNPTQEPTNEISYDENDTVDIFHGQKATFKKSDIRI